MQSRGYSLVEIIVVIGIMSILLAIVTINFRDYSRRYRAEAQTRAIYQELLRARSDAICQRRDVRVKLYPGRFEVYSTGNDGDSVAPVRTLPFGVPVDCSRAGFGESGYAIDFDSRGVTNDWCSICLVPEESSSTVDSVVVSETRVKLGKKELPDVCESAKILTK